MKKIAIIVCGMRYHNQQEFVKGAMRYVKEKGDNLFIFIGNTHYAQTKQYKSGAFKLYQFMNPEEYDGIIVFQDTIHFQPAQEYMMKKLKESCVPVISVNAKVEGMGYIGFDDYDAMYRMTEHIVNVHGIREIAYIDGPQGYSDARIRAKAYKDVLEKEKISMEKRWFYQGDFNLESGIEAIKEFHRMSAMPKALVCSNDSMAVGAVMALQDLGYRVPEDVIVTGYDNVAVAKNNSPRITTAHCDREQMGYRSCEYLMTRSEKEIRELSVVIPTQSIYSESCGCVKEEEFCIEEFKRSILRRATTERYYQNRINEMFSDFVTCDTTDELLGAIRKFVPDLEADYFYIAFRDMEAVVRKVIRHYSKDRQALRQEESESGVENYHLPLIYEKGNFSSCKSIERGRLLPDANICKEEGVTYFIMPLHYQTQFFGYCVVGNCRLSLETEIISHWLMNMGNCIENMIKRQALQRITQKLDRISAYDSLTGLYTRRAFQVHAEEFKWHAKSTGRSLFLCFVDADGLKQVNDVYGHQAGDYLIKTIAGCLKSSCRKEEICMRFGGDEFVVFGLEDVANSRHKQLEENFKEKLEHINKTEQKEYMISASFGSYVIDDVENTNLQLMLDKADTEMYLRKNARKRKVESK